MPLPYLSSLECGVGEETHDDHYSSHAPHLVTARGKHGIVLPLPHPHRHQSPHRGHVITRTRRHRRRRTSKPRDTFWFRCPRSLSHSRSFFQSQRDCYLEITTLSGSIRSRCYLATAEIIIILVVRIVHLLASSTLWSAFRNSDICHASQDNTFSSCISHLTAEIHTSVISEERLFFFFFAHRCTLLSCHS